jgi:hypothetical protein
MQELVELVTDHLKGMLSRREPDDLSPEVSDDLGELYGVGGPTRVRGSGRRVIVAGASCPRVGRRYVCQMVGHEMGHGAPQTSADLS